MAPAQRSKRKERRLSKPKEGGHKDKEVIEFTPSSSDGEGTLTKGAETTLESDSRGENDPLISMTIILMIVRVELMVGFSEHKGIMTALLDSGCTRCLVSPGMVEKLGMCLRQLKISIAFSQLDGTLTGGSLATFLTEPMELKIGPHRKPSVSSWDLA